MHQARCSAVLVTGRIGLLIVAFAVVILAIPAQAQSTDRAGKWEGTVQIRYSPSSDIHGAPGSHATIDDDYIFGLGFAYNFNDHFSLGADFA